MNYGSQGERSALELAEWLCAHATPRPDLFTHLKLQKLAFYSYGALLAFGLEGETGEVSFEAWKHGPVAPDVYRRYADYGREALPRTSCRHGYSARVESVLSDVLNVYGRMTAWQLREESHEEGPWQEAYSEIYRMTISTESLRTHFRTKFGGPTVTFPERLFGGSSFLLDRIPVPAFSSLSEMSKAATRILGDA